MTLTLFKVLVDVRLFEAKSFLNHEGTAVFSDAYFQFFGAIASSADRAKTLAKREILDGDTVGIEALHWAVHDFKQEFKNLDFNSAIEGIVYKSGRAFNRV